MIEKLLLSVSFDIYKMKLKELTTYFDSLVPLAFQESYDNSGLQIGNPEDDINSALITLDVTSNVLDEAITNKCDIIISHHPLIFSGLKKITEGNNTEKIISKAIKNNISIYSAHTNLDNFQMGVSRKMAEKLNLLNVDAFWQGVVLGVVIILAVLVDIKSKRQAA